MAALQVSRRSLVAAGAAALISIRRASAADVQTVEMQLGWIGGGNQLGEVAAQQLGYFEDEGLELTIVPGRPEQ